MGIDVTALESILLSLKYVTKNQNMLTLGRQQIHMRSEVIYKILNKNKIQLSGNYHNNLYCETFFKDIGFLNVDSIDASNYESATIVHNMNKPIPSDLKDKYNYIYDGGTIEHIFNIPQTFENIIDMLEVGGIFLSVTCNNNFSGHGMYQFSPEIFLSAFSNNYGMEIIDIFLAETDTMRKDWISVNSYNEKTGGRNISRFMNTREVYIITIARKISNDRESLINNSPQQYSYEKLEWKK
jgi:hypothetical protein